MATNKLNGLERSAVVKEAAKELREAWEQAESAEALIKRVADIFAAAKHSYGPLWEKDGAEAAIFHLAKQGQAARAA